MRALIRLLAINATITIALLLLAGAAAEAYLRMSIPSSSKESIFVPTLETKRYKLMRPNAKLVAWGSEFRTNSLGFRDSKDEIAPKAAGGVRIVVLGDSFTAAAGVDFDKTYPRVLEQTLRQQHPAVDVVNLAVGGYNLIQEELVLDEVAWSLDPDIILVAAFPFNDLSNETLLANKQEAEGKVSPPAPAYQQTYLYRAYLGRVEARLRRMFAPAPTAGGGAGHEDTAPRENLDALGRIVDKAHAHNVDVVVALLPNTDEFEAQRAQFAPFLKECDAHEWTCVNLIDDFIRHGAKAQSLRLNVVDAHPNDEYNAVVAGGLRDELEALVAKPR